MCVCAFVLLTGHRFVVQAAPAGQAFQKRLSEASADEARPGH